MGLYRRRIVRFILGIAVFIAVVQILTTLHFSSIYTNDSAGVLRQKTRRNELRTYQHNVLSEEPTLAKTSAVFDLRKSQVKCYRNHGPRTTF